MHVAARVRVGDGVRHRNGEVHRAPHVDRPPAHLGSKRLPLEELEDEVDAPFVLADVEHRGDVRMRERRKAARLFDERVARVWRGEVGRQEPHHDRAAKLRIARAEQLAWSGRLEPFEQVVVRDDGDRPRDRSCSFSLLLDDRLHQLLRVADLFEHHRDVERGAGPGILVLWQ